MHIGPELPEIGHFSFNSVEIKLFHELSAITRALLPGRSLTQRSKAPLLSNQNESSCIPIAAETLELFEVQVPLIVLISPFITLFSYMCRACYFRIAQA